MHPHRYKPSVNKDPLWPDNPSYPKVRIIRYGTGNYLRTPVSSNSSGSYANIMRYGDQTWQRGFIKNSLSVLREAYVLANVRKCFPIESVQTILAVDEDKRNIFFKHFRGETQNEVRLRYCHGQSPFQSHRKQPQRRTDEWFIDIDLRRASDVLAAYQESFRHMQPGKCSEQNIHKFYHDRLLNNHGFMEYYSKNIPTFLRLPSMIACLWRSF